MIKVVVQKNSLAIITQGEIEIEGLKRLKEACAKFSSVIKISVCF